MSDLSALRRDVGELLWIGFPGCELPDATAECLRAGDAGAVVLFRRNLPGLDGAAGSDAELDVPGLLALNQAIRDAEPEDSMVLIAVDQEGGRVQRVRSPGTRWPPMLSMDAATIDDAVVLAAGVGRALGEELACLGFDVDFAPVLDVHTNPANPIIGDRAFATVPDAVADRALAFAGGLAEAGIIGCGKHFPGHGDTDTDSHVALPRLPHELSRLRSIELVPFARAAVARLPMIMTAHVVFAALDPDVPATLSRRVITGLLRQELGYEGIIVSDDLDMKAVSAHYGVGDAAVRAITAGCDVLLLCEDPANQAAARSALIEAGQGDPAVRDRIAESAARVRALKAAHAPSRRPLSETKARTILGCAAHRALADALAATSS